MYLKHLQAFVQIADSGSFSAAGRALNTAQPSLSLVIKQLENELGAQLFTRHAKGVRLTDAGQRFYVRAKDILASIDGAKRVVKDTDAPPPADVAVALGPLVAHRLVPDLVVAAAHKYPEISLSVLQGRINLLHLLKPGRQPDIGLVYRSPLRSARADALIVENLVLISGAKATPANQHSISLGEVAQLPLVAPMRPNAFWDVIDDIAPSIQIAPKVWLDVFALEAITQLCQEGYHCILPHFAVTDEIARGTLAATTIVDPAPHWHVSVETSELSGESCDVQAIADLLRESVTGLVRAGDWIAAID